MKVDGTSKHRYRPARGRSAGFSLFEVAVVLVVVGLLVGGVLVPLSTQVELNRVRKTTAQLAEIKEALIGFAVRNGRLPCPATDTSNGDEVVFVNATYEGCGDASVSLSPDLEYGFLPARKLGLSGSYNAQQLLLDAWGNPIRYGISDTDTNGDYKWDFVVADGMRAVGLKSLQADLEVCSKSPDSSPGNVSTSSGACAADKVLALGVPAVVYSLGADGNDFLVTAPSLDQLENAGEQAPPAAALMGGYPVASDKVFVSADGRKDPGNEFDDILTWISPNVLYDRMISAGRLP